MNRLMFGFSWELVTVSYFRNELCKVLNLTLILIVVKVVKHLRNGTRYLIESCHETRQSKRQLSID